ncbi:MAG: hypothetical protein WC495_01510 [Patescibacteria group bacterium]|jgi:hypothetical protein
MKDILATLLPNREDVQLMIQIEDRFRRPLGLRQLILDWHQLNKRPIVDIAHVWEIEETRLRRWMRWYQINENEVVEEPPDPAPRIRVVTHLPVEEDDDDDGVFRPTYLEHITLSHAQGLVALKLQRLWFATHQSWDKVAEGLRCTRDELRKWVRDHLCEGVFIIIPSDSLKSFIGETKPTTPQNSQST